MRTAGTPSSRRGMPAVLMLTLVKPISVAVACEAPADKITLRVAVGEAVHTGTNEHVNYKSNYRYKEQHKNK